MRRGPGAPRSRASLGLATLVLLSCVAAPAAAHEPVFGVGPETIYKGGVGIELGYGYDDLGGRRDQLLNTEILYGATKDLSLTLEVPTLLRRETGLGSTSGLGDVLLRGKYRFWRRDRLGASERASVLLGVKFPTGAHHRSVRRGSGSFDALAGLSVAHESRRWYGFGTFRYVWRTEHDGFDRGDRVLFDVAAGFRPWLTEYLEPDLVLLLEWNGEWEGRDRLRGSRLGSTGGFTGWLGPTALLSYRNWMFKTGVQLPAVSDLNGGQKRPDLRTLAAIEYHF